jgi:hypothetical protein
MSKKETVVVEVSVASIKQAFEKVINSKHAPIIVDAIVKHLQESELGLEDLYHSLLGAERSFKYKPLDKVWISLDHLPSWRIDKDKSLQAGLIEKERFIKCTIIDINPLSRSCYKIEFVAIATGKDETGLQEYPVSEAAIYGREEEELLPF